MMVLDKQKGLKSLSKEKRQKLEAYQHLLYLLQVRGGPGRDHPHLAPAPPVSRPFTRAGTSPFYLECSGTPRLCGCSVHPTSLHLVTSPQGA